MKLYDKYRVERIDGKSDGPRPQYFVLMSGDHHARAAMQAYIESVEREHPEFAAELRAAWLTPGGSDGK